MARDGYPFVIIPLLVSTAAFYFAWWVLGVLALVLAGFMAFFFRDPERQIPSGENLVVSPADGRVVGIQKLDPDNPASPTKVSIFLSVFDVHINRAPIAGRIKDVAYHAGRFLAAYKETASDLNEQSVVTLEGNGIELVFKQIAGLIARRIVFNKQPGDLVSTGERVGLIKFGSRTDLILPPEVEITIQQGQKVFGGTTIIGTISHEKEKGN